MPRQPGGSTTIDKEAHWLPTVAGRVSVAVPEVVAVGEPGFGYPERWSVSRWIDGTHPDVPWDGSRGRSSQDLARQLGRFIGELRRVPVPAEAVSDPALRWYRGGRLADVDDVFRAAVAWCADAAGVPDLDLDLDRAQRVWDAAIAVERHLSETAPTWFHGDLLAENLLIDGDGLAAVLDFGGLAVGDPTVDLVVGWEVLDDAGRAALRAVLEVDEASWTRAAGWALLIALNTFPYYGRTMPARCAARRQMARAVIDSDVTR
jgi:aminoglycoside phosphotransferase (APT) family kinase protein